MLSIEREITRAIKKKMKHIPLTNSQIMIECVAKMEYHDKLMSIMTEDIMDWHCMLLKLTITNTLKEIVFLKTSCVLYGVLQISNTYVQCFVFNSFHIE